MTGEFLDMTTYTMMPDKDTIIGKITILWYLFQQSLGYFHGNTITGHLPQQTFKILYFGFQPLKFSNRCRWLQKDECYLRIASAMTLGSTVSGCSVNFDFWKNACGIKSFYIPKVQMWRVKFYNFFLKWGLTCNKEINVNHFGILPGFLFWFFLFLPWTYFCMFVVS